VRNATEFEDPLKHLPYASNASFNASYRQYDSLCLPGTRVEVRAKINKWANGEDKSCIFWLSGWPGTGKSAIARTIARQYDDQGQLAASFFFSRGGGDSSHAGLFVTSIARQLGACKALDVKQHIRASMDEHSQVAFQTLQDQWDRLILRPLLKCKKGVEVRTFLVVVDALDECEDERSVSSLLQLLPRVGELANVRLRILVTSRLERPIRHGFRRMGPAAHQDFVLHHITPEVTNKDIEVFLKHHLAEIATECYLSSTWPGLRILSLMTDYAQGLFIWAETACKFLAHDAGLVEERLSSLMNRNGSNITDPESHLDQIYTNILLASVPDQCSEDEQKVILDHLTSLLGAIIALLSTISATALGAILAVPTEKILRTISKLHSILDVPDDTTQPLRLHHDSFRNFLVDANRCKQHRLLIDVLKAHASLAAGSIRVMSSTLKENICNQEMLGVLASDLGKDVVQRCISPQAQYACMYWVSHVEKSGKRLADGDHVYKFLQQHILHWIEAMSWMGKTPEAIKALASLEMMTKVTADTLPLYLLLLHLQDSRLTWN